MINHQIHMYQESGWQPPRYHDALTFSEFPVHCVLVLGWLTHAFHDIQQGKCITYELRILFARSACLCRCWMNTHTYYYYLLAFFSISLSA